ncbi:MAG TPA: hypothetical protein DCZ95_18850 [Verrucomicrobia bacterium]|nr:MAG: hypothetical protein A2X46_17090 [Lentisphaerae bacterium GWF2_57_35]HBA86146.1 hypothetical protein [Verrucomicrobiota bacterium]
MKINVSHHVQKLIDHFWGPSGSVLIHILVILALIKFVTYTKVEKAPEVEVVIMDPDATDLEEFEKELEKMEDLPEVVNDEMAPPDVAMDQPPDVENFAAAEPDVDFAALDVQNDIQSPLVMRGLFQGRSASGRASALNQYSQKWGQMTEAAVLKALNWLKKHQNPDGSWSPNKPAMTGLALLTFLAHGETTSSEDYGQTVEKAIRFLVSQQDAEGRFTKIDQPGSYAHAIATYGISEAYGLTRVPAIKPVMEKAVQVILNGQQAKGGWDYDYKKAARRDTSVAGWQVQALKAAYIAGAENAGIKEAMDKALADLKSAFEPESGQFYYTDASGHRNDSITAIGVLCLQLLGHAGDREARGGLQSLQGTSCDWEKPMHWPMYGWYYITQAKFHQGGQSWAGWNAKFARVFVKNQNEDGSWTSAGANLDKNDGKEVYLGPVYATTLAALTLQVYYRFLPTYKPIAVEPISQTDTNDVVIEIL